MKIDTIIKGRYLLPMDEDLTIIKDGAVAIRGKKILDIDRAIDIEKEYQAEETIDAGNSIVMPGLINTHAHAAMTYFRGLADDKPLEDWWFNHIRPAEIKFVKPEFVKKATELACLEMIKSGTAIFNDMYYFSNEIAQVCKLANIKVMLSDALIDFPAPSYKNIDEALDLFHNFYKKYKNDDLVKVSIQPHTIYTCGKETLLKTKEIADQFKIPIHIHVSETEVEVNNCLEEHGVSVVKYLDNLGILGNNVIAAHSVWLDDDDLEIYKKRDVKVSHCPTSNMKLASGIAPITEMLKHNIKVGLGTDGAASNNTLDLFSEMKTTALLGKVKKLDPTVVPAREVVKMATIEGAKVLGLDKEIGSLEAGKQADLITIDLDKPHLTPIYDPYSHLVYCVTAQDVQNVIINGKIVMRDRVALTLDEEKILHEAKTFIIK